DFPRGAAGVAVIDAPGPRVVFKVTGPVTSRPRQLDDPVPFFPAIEAGTDPLVLLQQQEHSGADAFDPEGDARRPSFFPGARRQVIAMDIRWFQRLTVALGSTIIGCEQNRFIRR